MCGSIPSVSATKSPDQHKFRASGVPSTPLAEAIFASGVPQEYPGTVAVRHPRPTFAGWRTRRSNRSGSWARSTGIGSQRSRSRAAPSSRCGWGDVLHTHRMNPEAAAGRYRKVESSPNAPSRVADALRDHFSNCDCSACSSGVRGHRSHSPRCSHRHGHLDNRYSHPDHAARVVRAGGLPQGIARRRSPSRSWRAADAEAGSLPDGEEPARHVHMACGQGDRRRSHPGISKRRRH